MGHLLLETHIKRQSDFQTCHFFSSHLFLFHSGYWQKKKARLAARQALKLLSGGIKIVILTLTLRMRVMTVMVIITRDCATPCWSQGPGGVGKTAMVYACARELGYKVIIVSVCIVF